MYEVQYNYVPDQMRASPTAQWIDKPATSSTIYNPRVQDLRQLCAYLSCMQSC